MMSQMDAVTKFDLDKHSCELITNAINAGYKAVAITDHNGCQAFPICYEIIKIIIREWKMRVKDLRACLGLN